MAWWLFAGAVAAAALGALLLRRPAVVRGLRLFRVFTGVSATVVAIAGVLAVLAAWTAADAHQWSAPTRLAAVAAAVLAGLVLLGLVPSVARPALAGAAVLAVLAALWWGTLLLTDGDPAHTGAVQGVIAAAALGVLPRAALTDAGLATWGERRPAGLSMSRLGAGAALAAAHRGLVGATLVAAGSATAAGWLVGGRPSPSAVLFTAVLAMVLWARSRAYPLVAEVVLLRAGAVLLLVRLASAWMQGDAQPAFGAVVLLCAAAALLLVATSVQLPDQLRTRLSRCVDVAESAGAVALFPLALGVFGVHAHLLGAF